MFTSPWASICLVQITLHYITFLVPWLYCTVWVWAVTCCSVVSVGIIQMSRRQVLVWRWTQLIWRTVFRQQRGCHSWCSNSWRTESFCLIVIIGTWHGVNAPWFHWALWAVCTLTTKGSRSLCPEQLCLPSTSSLASAELQTSLSLWLWSRYTCPVHGKEGSLQVGSTSGCEI